MRETIFLWDSVDDCVMSELDGSGAVQVTYTNEPQQYGGVISQRRGTTTSTYHADALGSTRALTDNFGNVTDTYLNDAWGNSVASTGTTVNPFRWVGKYGYYTDNGTGQVYVRARMYQPTLARWCSLDPAFVHPAAWGFTYVASSPTLSMDPSGLLLVAVDGTGSRLFREGLEWDYVCEHYYPLPRNCGWKLVPSSNGPAPGTLTMRAQSHVRNFWQDYQSDPSQKWFHDGPDSNIIGIGGEVNQILWQAWNWVCQKYCRSECAEPIDMVGHSRGGHIVNELAHRLNDHGCTCKKGPVPVRFLGLYDPVNFLNGSGVHGSIAPNVEYCSHVLAAPNYMAENGILRSRRFWPRVDGYPESDGTSYRREMIIGTHSALGGAPWWGDWPPGHSARGDIAAAIAADTVVRQRALSAGSPISLVPDYGYAHPGTTPPGSPDSVPRRY